ncbi:hypothetical protein LPJ56_004042, partial [Coemansia sp. RSA 2599]
MRSVHPAFGLAFLAACVGGAGAAGSVSSSKPGRRSCLRLQFRSPGRNRDASAIIVIAIVERKPQAPRASPPAIRSSRRGDRSRALSSLDNGPGFPDIGGRRSISVSRSQIPAVHC